MGENQNGIIREQTIIESLQQQVKNNYFRNKEELANYLVKLRNNGTNINNDQTKELLNLFDSLNTKNILPLNMREYSNVGLENQNLIVSKNDDRILKTLEGGSEYTNDFLRVQNETIANTLDGQTNANEVFEHMAKHQKEQISLISLTEAIIRKNIDREILLKIRFFITNSKINPYSFQVDIETGIFFNVETKEVYEVRQNETTNQYEIFKGSEQVYGTNEEQLQNENEEPELESDLSQEQIEYDPRLNKPKVRVRKLEERRPYMNNAAFTKIGFLIMTVFSYAILAVMMLLLNKK